MELAHWMCPIPLKFPKWGCASPSSLLFLERVGTSFAEILKVGEKKKGTFGILFFLW